MQQAQPHNMPVAARPAVHRRWTVDRVAPLLMILPSVIAIAIFVYGFIAWTGVVSVSRWRGINPDFTFVGLENYIRIFGIARFQTDIRNTVVFTLLFLLGCLGIGLLLAVLLDSRVRGEAIFRSIYLFPMALSFIVTGTVWQWLFAPGTAGDPTGLNLLLQRIGLPIFQDWSTTAYVAPGGG
jgi:glucose/mannose transport system permease protein